MPHPPLRLALFDMDDVLCRYDRPLRLRLLSSLCGQPVEAIDASIWRSGFEHEADHGDFDAAAYLAGFGARLRYPLSEAEWVANRKASMTPFPEMLALVAALKRQGVTVAILSNNNLLTGTCLDRLFPELRPLFGKDILMSAELAVQKPDPAIYRLALERFGARPDEALFVDDSAENVAGAKAAGLHGHHFDGIDGLRRRLADFALSV